MQPATLSKEKKAAVLRYKENTENLQVPQENPGEGTLAAALAHPSEGLEMPSTHLGAQTHFLLQEDQCHQA